MTDDGYQLLSEQLVAQLRARAEAGGIAATAASQRATPDHPRTPAVREDLLAGRIADTHRLTALHLMHPVGEGTVPRRSVAPAGRRGPMDALGPAR